jgi:hypothetical protein
LLNQYVFKDIKSFVYASVISAVNVQDTLFSSFKSLREFTFYIPSMREYLKSQNLTWSFSLNSDVKIDLNNKTQLEDPLNKELHFKLAVIDVYGDYAFPESDFCLYKDFPHDQLVFPVITTQKDVECSCSLVWLLQYWPYYKNPQEMNTTSVRQCFVNNKNFTQLFNECNFEERINSCNIPIGQCEYTPDISFLNCTNIPEISEVTGESASTIETLLIRPRLPVTLDLSLNLTGFETKLTDNYQIYLQNFKSFNFLENPFSALRKSGNLLYLDDMSFAFGLASGFDLSLNCIFWSALDFKPIFSSFESLFIERNVKFLNRVCPLVFQNSNIKRLIINSLSVDNNLIFIPVIGNNFNSTNNITYLNSNIESFEVYRSSLRTLDQSLLNPYVFERIRKFIYYSSTSNLSINKNLFENLLMLKELSLFVPSVDDYIKYESFDWILSLNPNVFINPENESQLLDEASKDKQFKLKMTDTSEKYAFPERDYCLYNDFPHYKLIYPIINVAPDLECTCSLLRLTQYAAYYKDQNEIKTYSTRKCLSNPNFSNLVKQCNFAAKALECDRCSFYPFPDLTLDCNDVTDLESLNFFKASAIKTLKIRPKNRVIFDGNLNTNGQERKFLDNYEIYLENFEGFRFSTSLLNSIGKKPYLLRIKDSNFNFYLNGNNTLSSPCIFNSPLDNRPLLSDFEIVRLEKDVDTSLIQCPLMFQNANMKRFILNSQSETNKLIFRPLLSSFPNSENTVEQLNSRIESFEIYNSELKYFDSQILNRYIFKDIKSLTYLSLISNINFQDDLFVPFKSLKELNFYVPNLELYLRNQDLMWSLSLNSDVKVDLKNKTQLESDESKNNQFKLNVVDIGGSYLFPEKDFCLFTDFPHSQSVFPIINTVSNLSCTCSLLWVIQYAPYYKNQSEIRTNSVRNCLDDPDFDQNIIDCDFEQKIKICDSITSTTPSRPAITTSTSTTTTQTPSSGLEGGAIAGIVIGSLGGVTIITIGGYFLYKYIKKSKIMPGADQEMKTY